MEMANYIFQILRSQPLIIWSWGFNSPEAVLNGLRFNVSGFKFSGIVEILYNDGSDLFDIYFFEGEQKVDVIYGCYIDMLIDVIDNKVEKVDNYIERESKANTSDSDSLLYIQLRILSFIVLSYTKNA